MGNKIFLIQKLLDKAESTPYPAEAETFLNAATKLMVRLGVDEAMLASGSDAPPANIVEEEAPTFTGVYALPRSVIASAVADALGLAALQRRKPDDGGYRVFFVGPAPEVGRAITLSGSLDRQAMMALGTWWSGLTTDGLSRSEKTRERKEFLRSFGLAAADRIARQREEATEETGAALVLANRDTVIEDYLATKYPSLEVLRRTARTRGSLDARAAGEAAGERADIGGARLTAPSGSTV